MVQQYDKNLIRRGKSFLKSKITIEKEENQINYETAIKGTTLEVYFYLLRKSPAGVREIQRALTLSSPSVSSYHLDKLESIGVIQKNRFGNYEITKKIDIGALNQFVMIKNFTLPRFLFYAVFITTLFIGYVFFFLTVPISIGELFALIFGLSALLICWIETILSWYKRPF